MENQKSISDEKTLISTDFCKISAIQHILNGTPEFCNFYLSYLPSEESLNIIQSLFVSDPPNIFKTSKNIPTAQHYRWMLSCFISQLVSLIPNHKKFILPSYYFNVEKRIQLSLHNTKTANSINKLVSNPLIRTSNDLQVKLAKLLLSLYNENRPLFDWILEYKEVNKYIKNISLPTLYSQFNFQCFELYPVEIKTEDNYNLFNDTEISKMIFFFKEKEEIETFFQIPSVLFDAKPIVSFQNSYFKDHPFPFQYPFMQVSEEEEENKCIFSLLHTSISMKIFFVDIVKKDFSKVLAKNSEDLQEMQESSQQMKNIMKCNEVRLKETVNNGSFLNEMQSWTFLSLFPDILKSYPFIYDQIECVSFVSDSIVTNLFERLKNDRILFNSIFEWTGKSVKTDHFLMKSLPIEILDNLANLDSDTIETLVGEKPLFCLSDDAKNTDCDFLNGYFAISNALKAISVDQDFDQIQPIAEEIGFCIEKINSNDKKNSIITDIFSLLFLTKDDKFVFQTLPMQTILQVLLTNSNEQLLPYLNNGLIQIQLFERTSSNLNVQSNLNSLSNLFISSKTKLLYALAGKNTVFAENLAKTSQENQKFYNCYITVTHFTKKEDVDLNEDGQNLSSEFDLNKKPIEEIEEVAFSIEGQSCLFDRIQKESQIPEVKKLTEICDYHKPFKIFKTLSKIKLNFLKEKLKHENNSEWKIPSFVVSSSSSCEDEKKASNSQQIFFNNQNELKNINLLKGFFDYLDLLIPTLLSPGQTIDSILNKSVDEVLDEFLSKEEFEKAEKLSETMKVDIKKKVLSSLKYQQKCYEHYCEGSKPTLTILAVLGNWKEYFEKLNPDKSSQKVLRNLLSDTNNENHENLRKFIFNDQNLIHSKSENISDEIEFNDNFYQKGFTVTDQVLNEVFERDDKELFIELCYRSTTSQIEKVFNGHLNNESIEKLYEMTEVCPVSFELRKKYRLLLDLHLKYSFSISNISQAFSDLLADMKYFDAQKIYNCFSENSEEFDQIVRQTLQNSKDGVNKADIGIITVVPHMKDEILQFFKKMKVEEQELMFQEMTPSNWIYMNDFKETVEANIYNDPIGAIEVLKEFNSLNCDQIIIEFLNQTVILNDDILNQAVIQKEDFLPIAKINFLRQECNRFLVVMRDPSLMYQFVSSNLVDILLSITVDSKDKETYLNFYMHRMIDFLNSKMVTQTTEDKKILSLFHLCSQYLFMKYEFVYFLNDIEKVINFCVDRGLYSIAKEVSEAFSIDLTEKAFEVYLKGFRFYIYGENPPLPFSLKLNALSEKVKFELQQKCSLQFAFFASNKSEFNGSLIKGILASIDDNKLANVTESILTSSMPYFYTVKDNDTFALNEKRREVFEFFTKESDIETAMKFYVNDIDKGFLILEKLNDNLADQISSENEIKRGFITLYIQSISFSKMNIFMRCFREADPCHTKYAPFLVSMDNECDASEYPFLKLSISQIIGDYITTARTSLDIYTFRPELAYLDIAESSLIELKNSLIDKSDSQILTLNSPQPEMHSKNNSESLTVDENLTLNSSSSSLSSSSRFTRVNSILSNIERTLKKISLQRQFVVFCFERNLAGFESLNLFCGDAAVGSIVTLLFKNSEFHLALDILNTLNLPENGFEEYRIEPCQNRNLSEKVSWFNLEKSQEIEKFLSRAAFSLANDGFDAISKLLFSLQKNLKNEELFEKIMYAFIRQFEMPPFNETGWIKKIALGIIKNVEFKARILIEIGEYDIAADIAIDKKNKLEHLIPLIAHLSFWRSNMNTYYKCQKALESM
ncbi:hypothetical protein M9Y10_022958 [Tritrichomonas musculus]|uniref:Spatacsin C-terminal domain-containing protein n=1 Tax=Tritrichomonas musculus TaxID=1915356 RepID=A0ABR2KTT4_9EUKA